MSKFQTDLASEEAVRDFILAAKSIVGVNLTPRDERMLETYLIARKVTGGGIEVTFTPRKVAMANRDFSAEYSRR